MDGHASSVSPLLINGVKTTFKARLSGSEHHISHYLEIRALQGKMRHFLHGEIRGPGEEFAEKWLRNREVRKKSGTIPTWRKSGPKSQKSFPISRAWRTTLCKAEFRICRSIFPWMKKISIPPCSAPRKYDRAPPSLNSWIVSDCWKPSPGSCREN